MAPEAHEGQRTYGTFRDHYRQLQQLVINAIEQGAATPEEYQGTLLQILKAIEGLRVKNEAALLKLKEQEAYHTSAVNSCSMLSSLILNIVDARTRERLRILEGAKALERRQLEEDKARLEDFRAGGKIDEAEVLAQSIKEREAELQIKDELGVGSAKEAEITRQAVQQTASALGGGCFRINLQPQAVILNGLKKTLFSKC